MFLGFSFEINALEKNLATSCISSVPIPNLVNSGVPNLSPLGDSAFVSPGNMFMLVIIPESSNIFAAFLPAPESVSPCLVTT